MPLGVLTAYASLGGYIAEKLVYFYHIMYAVMVTHVVLTVCVKVFKKRLFGYRRHLYKAVTYIRRKKIYTIIYSWLLCCFVYGTYVNLLSCQKYPLGGLSPFCFLPLFSMLFLRKKWREKFLFGIRAIYRYVQASLFMFLGMCYYLMSCTHDWLWLTFFERGAECADGFYIEPQFVSYLAYALQFAILLAFPFMLYSFCCICKSVYCRMKK